MGNKEKFSLFFSFLALRFIFIYEKLRKTDSFPKKSNKGGGGGMQTAINYMV